MDRNGYFSFELTMFSLLAASMILSACGMAGKVSIPETDLPQIAFIAGDAYGLGELYVYDESTQTSIQLTHTNGQVSWAEWSPDGRYLAYYREDKQAVYRFDVTNGDDLRLSPTGTPECYHPEWSPDGTQLLCSNSIAAQPGLGQIFLLGWDDGGFTHLASGSRAAWSSDGSRLIFVTQRDPEDPNSDVDIAWLEIASGEVAFLAEFEGDEYKPQWSPDGTMVAFVENSYGNQGGLGLQTLKLWNGETVTTVADQLWSGDSEFEFSPDGQTLRYFGCEYDIASATNFCDHDSVVTYSPDGSLWASVRDGQLCRFPMGFFQGAGCVDLPKGFIRLLDWRP